MQAERSGGPTGSPPSYRERLAVPPGWWALALLFCGSMLLAIGYYLGWWAGAVAFAVPFVAVAALFVGYGAIQVRLEGQRLQVGRASIDLTYVSGAVALDAAAARERRGPKADVRAFLALRPYVATAVEVTLDDAADPAPYWLVSSRTPKRLASAINASIAASVGG